MFPLSHMLKSFVRVGTLTITDADGKTHVFGGTAPGPNVTARITDRRLYYRLFLNPTLYVGEAYMDGGFSFENNSTVRDFLELFALNRTSLGSYPILKVLRYVRMALKGVQQANRMGKAQQNVAHHYDIGNPFYKLFLDKSMQYSCAYFANDGDTLEEAQMNKMRLIASKLQLKPGLRILDIGSGWGSLALYLASLEKVDITGVTLSKEQHALANAKARELGLSDRVRFELRDYRELDQTFDRIVSVGMFEHVGVPHYAEFFDKVRQMLTDDGVMLLHTIARSERPSAASPWIRKYIFPGGYVPALSEIMPAIQGTGLLITDMEYLRLHYAKTAREWSRRFDANRDKAKAMYDERFCRMWEFYLASAEMSFVNGSQHVLHMQIAKKLDGVPIVRDYITDLQRHYRTVERPISLMD